MDLRATTTDHGDAAATVTQIIQAVQQDGDDAVVRYMRQWTDPDFSKDRIRVARTDITTALNNLGTTTRDAIQRAIDNVTAYQSHILPTPPQPFQRDGATLGLRFTPVASLGLTVPGGRAAYPSTVVMLTVPALVAGVPADAIHVVSPPPTRQGDQPPGDISPLVLATCAMLGITNVYRIGGAQAVAALAIGTECVPATNGPDLVNHPGGGGNSGGGGVDFIAGPGNVYTQLAKLQLAGRVGIDGFYGPSEIVTIADNSANPDWVAADLIAQAEHDPGRCILIACSQRVIDNINRAIAAQLTERTRRAPIEQSFKDYSATLLAPDEQTAADLANAIAPEHLSLAVADPDAWLPRIQNAGEIFLGHDAPVAAGDYIAGPSHCLPTNTTARFTSGVSVYTFLKRTGTVAYPNGLPRDVADPIATLANAESLDAHANSARIRRR